jgi:hypothetical protein
VHDALTEEFSVFFREVEPRLRHALVASCGFEAGREAAADALAYAWEHWDRVQETAAAGCTRPASGACWPVG